MLTVILVLIFAPIAALISASVAKSYIVEPAACAFKSLCLWPARLKILFAMPALLFLYFIYVAVSIFNL